MLLEAKLRNNKVIIPTESEVFAKCPGPCMEMIQRKKKLIVPGQEIWGGQDAM